MVLYLGGTTFPSGFIIRYAVAEALVGHHGMIPYFNKLEKAGGAAKDGVSESQLRLFK